MSQSQVSTVKPVWLDYAFIANDLNERAKLAGYDGLSDESLTELADQLATDGDTILDYYEARLGVNVDWARSRLDTLYWLDPMRDVELAVDCAD